MKFSIARLKLLLILIGVCYIITPFISLANTEKDNYRTLGNFYMENELYDEALDKYKKASELDPNDVEIRKEIVRCYIFLGDFSKAKYESDEIIRIKSDYSDIYPLLGFTLSRLGEYDEAIAVYKKRLTMEPSSPEYLETTYNNLASVYMIKGSYEDAMTMIKKALELDPEYVTANITLSEIYEKLGQYHEALNILKQLKDVPRHFEQRVQDKILQLESLIESEKQN